MELINPNEIGAKISTLIAESENKFYAVTAFINLSAWKKILINLQKAKKRGVEIKFFYREIRNEDYQILKNIGIDLYEIKGLHTKLYFNENEMIVSSMNFYEYSDLHSIDIAIKYSDAENYGKLFLYFQKYILSTTYPKELIAVAQTEENEEGISYIVFEDIEGNEGGIDVDLVKWYIENRGLLQIGNKISHQNGFHLDRSTNIWSIV